MDNTIIINKAILHQLNFETGEVTYSDKLLNLDQELSLVYFHKKINKALSSSSISECVVGSQHHLLKMAEDMTIDDESFISCSKEICANLFSLGKNIEEIPNSTVFISEILNNGTKYILILKLNHKQTYKEYIDENGNVHIKMTQQLPTASSIVDEAIIINIETKTLSIIQKKFKVDGKKSYYLNDQWIHADLKLSDKEKISIIKKTIKKVESEYNLDKNGIARLKQYIEENSISHTPLNAIDIIQHIFKSDYDAREDGETILKDIGFKNDENIKNVELNTEKCKIKLDNGIEIIMPTADYVTGTNYKTENNKDGTYSITLDNFSVMDVN